MNPAAPVTTMRIRRREDIIRAMAGHGTLKQRLRQLLTQGPLRALAAPAFDLGVASEVLVAERLERRAPDTSLDGELTVLIKTFERPHTLARLVKSIRRRYPTLTVIVVDDSRHPEPLPSVETIVLPFDSGVSAGRQAGLDRVTTPYVLVLDDDFVFYRGTHLAPAVWRIAQQPAIDILGGQLIDLPLLRRRQPPIGQIFPTRAQPLVAIGSTIDGLPVCDKVANFYIARTDR